jgi:hypothetical protein
LSYDIAEKRKLVAWVLGLRSKFKGRQLSVRLIMAGVHHGVHQVLTGDHALLRWVKAEDHPNDTGVRQLEGSCDKGVVLRGIDAREAVGVDVDEIGDDSGALVLDGVNDPLFDVEVCLRA